MKKIMVDASVPYPIYISDNLLSSQLLVDSIRSLASRSVIVTDTHLLEKYAEPLHRFLQQHQVPVELMSFPAGEAHKTRETKQLLEDQLFLLGCQRDTVILAVGGGVVTDLAGFLASTYYRGVPAVYLPTTLLAMVDASVGGKTAVNTAYGKNMIGTFTPPRAVMMDPSVLKSLPLNELCNGVVEMIKHALISDAVLFKQLFEQVEKIVNGDTSVLSEIIEKNCLIKKLIVEQDETDKGMRHLLNFGHTIGHAIETIEEYQVSHGEAVAIGILVESFLSVQRGYLTEEAFSRIKEIFSRYRLPLKTKAFSNKDLFWKMLSYDKKTVGEDIHVVMLDAIGKPHKEANKFTVVPTSEEINQGLDWAKNACR